MDHATLLVAIGILFLAGLALESIGRNIHVPRVTLLILLGAVLGPSGLDLLPNVVSDSDEIVAPAALTMVAFLMGSSLLGSTLRAHGRYILTISITVVILSVALVAGGLMLVGVPAAFAFLLAAISAATDPAATMDVIGESGKSGRFVHTLRGIVAIDDAWGLVVFSVIVTFVGAMLGNGQGALWHGLREGGGSILLGLAVGLPGAYLTGRVRKGEPTLIEALGLVFLCAGLALHLGLSYLLAGMVAGATIVNLAEHHDRPFHEIERIEWPFLLVFFVMAGAALDLRGLLSIGAIGAAYVALRAGARILGAWVGARLAGMPGREGRLMGMALMPQAGVSIGMALVVAERFPRIGAGILTITIASTVIFEIVGPMLTLYALDHTVDVDS